MAGRPYIDVVGLTKRYGAAVPVDAVSFSAGQGEFLTFLGPSGCGKTTTLRCIGGFTEADVGDILIGGVRVNGVPPHRRELGMVFQNYALFPHFTVFENVAFGLRIRKMAASAIATRVERVLGMVRLEGLGGRLPKQLSGGQQQRVALARALVYEPKVLLLDEPLSNLDAKLRVEMRAEIRSLQKQLGITAIYVTHDQEEALSVSDRVVVMNRGRIEQISSPWQLYNEPQSLFVASFVGTANILPVTPSEAGHGHVRLAGQVDVPRPAGLAAGPIVAIVRPENIDAVGKGAYTIEGHVRAISLLGATVRIEIDAAAGSTVLADMPHGGVPPAIAPGGKIVVGLDPAKIVFVPDDRTN